MEAKTYVAEVFGWMSIVEAPSKREAVAIAKRRARSASLLSSDVTASHVRRAKQEDIDWYWSMT